MKFVRIDITKKTGFTLLELFLVTIILIVIAGLTIPNFGPTYLQFQLKESANNLSYMMRYAQSRAVIEGQDHRLEFNPDYSRYWLTRSDSTQKSESEKFKRISGRLGRDVSIPKEINIEASNQYVNFLTNGRIDKVSIHLCINEKCYTVSSQEQSGYVEVYESKLES